ncbi:MAG: heme-copper oxidase subunit III [Actinomycetota bacterium]
MATEALGHGHHDGVVSTDVSKAAKLSQGLLGMVIFIGSEVMLFASLFTAYFMARYNIAEGNWPPLSSDGEPFELPKLITGVNTVILVFSSFTIWYAEHSLRHGNRKGLIRGLGLTLLLGATFLVIQINEYAHLGFTPADKAFGSTFYTLTGFHGAHVFVGLTILTFCFIRAKVGDFSPTKMTPLAAGSVYWHFVDVVWVLLYILVYLLS